MAAAEGEATSVKTETAEGHAVVTMVTSNEASAASPDPPSDKKGMAGAAAEAPKHAAFMFIKPHACNSAVQALVSGMLAEKGLSIVGEGRLEAEEIDQKLYIDTHYGAIAKRAVRQKPHELNVPPKAQADYEKAFGLPWTQALEQGLVLNATDAAERLKVDGEGLEAEWRKLEKNVNLIKFGGGFYCGKLSDEAGEFYVINAFYLQMRSVFTTPPAAIYWFAVEWDADSLSWGDFRANVLGATDPTTAPDGSIRKAILDQYESLGLDSKPNTGNNGVHGSASPIEGLFERMNWLQADIASDVYGKALIGAGIPAATIMDWSSDPAVKPGAGDEGLKSLFDLHEDLDFGACTAMAVQVYEANKE